MAYLFCLLEAQRNSRRRAEGMNRDDETVSNEIEGGFHPCDLTQREGSGAGCLRLQFYLYILKGETRGMIQKSVSGRRNFFYSADRHLFVGSSVFIEPVYF